MQAILNKLNNDKLSREEIYEIISKTNRRDVLLNVMKTYPKNTDLIMTIAEWKLTMSDYEYAKENLDQETVSKFKDMILDKISSIGNAGCEEIRDVFGEDHNVTKCAETAIHCLSAVLEQCDPRTGEYNYIVEEYLAGARKIADVLEELIDNNPDPDESTLFYIYKVAERIDPENLGNSFELSLVNIPNERKLHKLIAEKQEDVEYYIEYIEEHYPDRVDLLEILKKKL